MSDLNLIGLRIDFCCMYCHADLLKKIIGDTRLRQNRELQSSESVFFIGFFKVVLANRKTAGKLCLLTEKCGNHRYGGNMTIQDVNNAG